MDNAETKKPYTFTYNDKELTGIPAILASLLLVAFVLAILIGAYTFVYAVAYVMVFFILKCFFKIIAFIGTFFGFLQSQESVPAFA